MDFIHSSPKPKKNSPLMLSVLCSYQKNQLREIKSNSSEFRLFKSSLRKNTLLASTFFISKTKLLTNLQIYQWRFHTKFPIIKTAFVHIKQKQFTTQQIMELQIYNEYCPWALTQIYQMSIGQTLYILKEAIIGFQRLYNRFGGFQVQDSMIKFNQKGFCKVWLNENSALNYFPKIQISQNEIVTKIISIILLHSQQSKFIKKIFTFLKQCKTFLSCLRVVQQFVKQTKIIVPTKFTNLSSDKQIQVNFSCKAIQKFQYARFSVKQEKLPKFRQSYKDSIENSYLYEDKSSSQLQIKRTNSEKSFECVDPLKVSQGQTSYTDIKNRTSNIQQGILNFPFGTQTRNLNYSNRKIEQSMKQFWEFFGKKENKYKNKAQNNQKQLTHSAYSERKCTTKPSKSNKPISQSKYAYFSKKYINQPYFTEFSDLLNRDEKNPESENKIEEEIEETRYQHHSGEILKNNGWILNVQGLLELPTNIKESFYSGNEESVKNTLIKLERLNLIGKQQMYMSILYEQKKDFV